MSRPGTQTDEELLAVDVAEVIATSMRTADPARHLLIGAAVPAALQAARVGAQSRSVAFLAEVVRRGGIGYAARLSAPLPTPEQSALVRTWLVAAQADDAVAGWLDAVASIIEARAGRP